VSAAEPGYEVRAATAADADAVLEMYEWLFEAPGAPPPNWEETAGRERLLATIEGEGSEMLVALDDGELVGFCSAYIDLLSIRYGPRCWVEDLAVDPDQRSNGVGSALLAAARAWATDQGASHLQLVSAEARTDAHRFYEREGGGFRAISFVWGLGR
jgi:GNAT superfamily N-acetyltransferase